MNTPDSTPTARERLLAAATSLFYAEGIHAVGVDRVIAEAAVTKATFYRHFPSKDELVTAYIEQQDASIRARFAAAASLDLDPRALLKRLVGEISADICGLGFRGCPFINAAAEFPDPTHPVRQAVARHRAWFRQTLADLSIAAEHPDPKRATAVLVLLRDGAMAGGPLEADSTAVCATLTIAVDELFDATAPRPLVGDTWST